jgi:hypothetical protein
MDIIVWLLLAACAAAALPVLVSVGRSWRASVMGAKWAAGEFGFRQFDIGRSIDVMKVLDRADSVLGHG